MSTTPDPMPRPYKPRHTLGQRALLAVNLFIVVSCVGAAAGLVYAKQQADLRLQTPAVVVATTNPGSDNLEGDTPASAVNTDPATGNTFPPADPEARNFLITGSDTNACVDPGSQWAGAADPARENLGNRSDTIMVMRVDPSTNGAAVLSFPRDLWVDIPGKGDSRINAAYVQDDYSLLAQTLYDNFGIIVDHYIQVDFCAFKRIVEAVGGVKVPFEFAVRDANVGIDIDAGCHTFGGDEALAYVRSRHLKWIDENGRAREDRAADLGRISRQQDFLRRVLQAALEKGLFDPSVARALIESLQTDVVTEAGFTLIDMLRFAGVMKNVDPNSIRTYQIEGISAVHSNQAVLEPDFESDYLQAILDMFRGVTSLTGAPAEEAPTTTAVGSATTSTAPADPSVTTTTTGVEENVKGDVVPPKNVSC